jgi:2-methylcitrate dehydratase PrpD
MTALEQLGAFVAGYRPDARTSAAVRWHVLDTIGASIAATTTPEGRALINFRGKETSLTERLAIRCALARLSEIDDIHLAAMITPGAIVVPAALTIADARGGANPEDLAAAIAAGYEAMVRLGVAIDGPTVLYRGIWPTYFAAPFGVAAAAARLIGLDGARTAQALAIALTLASPGVGRHGAATTARWLAVGQAASRGWQAACAAQAGFTADLGLLESDFFGSVYALTPDARVLGEGFSDMALHRVSFKPWCAARQTMAATQALTEILAEGVPAQSITRIEVGVLPPHVKMVNHGVTPGDRASYLTSVPYQMAVAALAPQALCSLAPLSGPPSAAIASLITRIDVRADDGLLAAGYPHAWPAHVTVVTDAGRHARTVVHVPGDPERPLAESDLKEKFIRLVAPVHGDGAETLFARARVALEDPQAILEEIARTAGR